MPRRPAIPDAPLTTVGVRVPPAVRSALERQARFDGRNLSGHVRRILIDAAGGSRPVAERADAEPAGASR